MKYPSTILKVKFSNSRKCDLTGEYIKGKDMYDN